MAYVLLPSWQESPPCLSPSAAVAEVDTLSSTFLLSALGTLEYGMS